MKVLHEERNGKLVPVGIEIESEEETDCDTINQLIDEVTKLRTELNELKKEKEA